jgi:hypothetical protein
VDHVYEKNDPTKNEVHATTSEDPVTRNIVIKISKQILSPDGTMRQTKIENAKTILHECIHAYLFVSTLNEMYPTPLAQHDFMYVQMIPTMQKVLGKIRDLVTKQINKDYLQDFILHPTTSPLTSLTWNCNNYLNYLFFSGLENTYFFMADFTEKSYEFKVFSTYISNGHNYLNK